DPAVVKMRVTIELENVPIGPALDTIVRSNELEIVPEAGGIMRVVERRKVARVPEREEITVHIPVNWVSSEEVKKVLQPISAAGYVSADPLSNSLLIKGTPLEVEELTNAIIRIDKPEKQVMLEVRLVEMNTDLSRGLGISWDLSRVDRDVSQEALALPVQKVLGTLPAMPVVYGYDPVTGLPLTYTPPGAPIIGADPGASLNATNPLSYLTQDLTSVGGRASAGLDSFQIYEPLANELRGLKWGFGKGVTLFGQEFQLSTLIEAAERSNLAKVLASPRVATVNNQLAKINILRQIPYSTVVVGAGGTQAETYAFEPVGLQIEITPNITNNDYVRMNIKVTQKILISQSGLVRPTVDERISETNAIVYDEDTAIIAGLRQQQFNETASGAPWLGQVPILGWLFKSKTWSNRKTDLMAFVTPHIIKEEQALSDQERQRYNELDIQWDLPDYFFDDVKFDLNR
ncbi:hypothetical protein FJY63_06275, partial [Candidatus Sumerlaeota bacterium]|nr:hypothetical protein [Candidatus Sumerlaeota bacterium]